MQTPDGYDFSTLYDDMAASNLATSTNTADHIFAVDAGKGITFEMIGSGFTYDAGTHNVTGGTITEIDVLNTTDPTQTTQDHVLVNTNGWNINAAAFFGDIGQYGELGSNCARVGPGRAQRHLQRGDLQHRRQRRLLRQQQRLRMTARTYSSAATTPTCSTACRDHSVRSIPATTPWIIPTPAAGVTANLLNPASNTGAAAGDIYISIENLRGTAFRRHPDRRRQQQRLEGGLGNDVMSGGPGGFGGFDTVSYEHATAGVTVSLNTTLQQDTVGAGLDTLSNFEAASGIELQRHPDRQRQQRPGGRAG